MPSDPLVLAFDTSAAHCAAALLRGDRIVATRHEDMAKGQAERLMGLLAEVLAEGEAAPRDLTAIGVGTGPGNFTGIRLSVAAARGLGLSLGIPAIGVSMLEALAEGSDGPVLACLAARREQVFVQGFGGIDLPAAQHAIADLPASGPDCTCIGSGAADVAAQIGAETRTPRRAPAEAIAFLAARRALTGAPRPVPLYLRAADAAPARDTGPLILS